MNLKTPFTYFLVILLASQLASCATASPTPEIITLTPLSTLTPTAIPTPSETPTPQPTGTNTASPTPEIMLIGLEPDLKKFPLLTAEEEQKHLQAAIDTRSLKPLNVDGIPNSYLTQDIYSNIKFGDYIRVVCRFGYKYKGCLIRDSYQIETTSGIVRKVLLEIPVTFEDNSAGSVILPIIIDQDWFDPLAVADQYTWGRLNLLSKTQEEKGIIDYINIVHKLAPNSRETTNPVIKSLLEVALQDGSSTKELLDKMYALAGENKSLTQDEINKLIDAIIWY